MNIEQVADWLKQIGPHVTYRHVELDDEGRHVWIVTNTIPPHLANNSACLSVTDDRLGGMELDDTVLQEGIRRYQALARSVED